MKILNFFKKFSVIIFIYIVLFLIFYLNFIFLTSGYNTQTNNLGSIVYLFALFALIPFLSFLIMPKYFIKKFNFNKYFAWIFHSVIIFIFLYIFIIYLISSSFQNFGGF